MTKGVREHTQCTLIENDLLTFHMGHPLLPALLVYLTPSADRALPTAAFIAKPPVPQYKSSTSNPRETLRTTAFPPARLGANASLSSAAADNAATAPLRRGLTVYDKPSSAKEFVRTLGRGGSPRNRLPRRGARPCGAVTAVAATTAPPSKSKDGTAFALGAVTAVAGPLLLLLAAGREEPANFVTQGANLTSG